MGPFREALTAGPPSPENLPGGPPSRGRWVVSLLPAKTESKPLESLLYTRLPSLDTMYKFPAASLATPKGLPRLTFSAVVPSDGPPPAIVLIVYCALRRTQRTAKKTINIRRLAAIIVTATQRNY